MANNKPFIVKSGLIPQTHNDQDLGHATSKFANAHISNLAGAVQIDGAYTLPTSDGTAEQVIKTDGAGNLSFTTISTNFLGLTDVTPNSFTGQAGKVVSVNTAEDAVEFVDISTDFLGLTDVTPNSFTGQAGKVVVVNTAEDAVEFGDLSAVTFSDTAPGTPQAGDLWFDSGNTAELFIWTGSEWISATGGDQAAFTMRDFTGDGNTTAFDTGNPNNVSFFVYLNGILLKETNDYSVATGVITFVTAPALNDNIQVIIHGNAEYIDLSSYATISYVDSQIQSQDNTDEITEGSNNLYYTDARVQTKLGNVSGDIIPDTNIAYDLGSATNRFRDLYLSGNSITLGTKQITQDNIPEVDLAIAPEILEIQVDAPAAGQDTAWLWTWEQSTLPYARRTITNSPEVSVPLYKQGTYTINNYAAYDVHGSMTQTHTLYFKWIDSAGTDNLVSWVTSSGPVSDTHPDINGGTATDVQRLSISVPATITLPTLTAPSVSYTVTNNGSGAYTFSGSASGDNPNIGPFYRGGTYTFNVSASGHPLYFTTDNGTNFSAGTYFGEYTTGVTGSRTDSGTVTFVVPSNAPDTLYYQCGNHSAMRGAITIKDLAVETNINGNYVIYAQHTQEGHKTPVELRPIPSLVNQMCLVYDSTSGKFVPQDLATYVENTPSFENKIREVAGTAELVVEDGSTVVAKVNVYDDSTYLPLTGNNAGDQAFATDTNILYIWDGTAWQQAGTTNTDDLTEGSNNLFFTDARADARVNVGIANLVDSAPATLDTLNELAAALGDDPNFATTTANNIATKLPLAGGTMTGDLIMTSGTKLSVDNPSPLSKFQVGSDPITTAIPTVTVGDLGAGASLLLRGLSPTLIFDQTGGGHGRIIQDGVDLSFYDGDFDNPGNVIMTVGTDSVSFNKQPILPKVSSPNTPYEGGLYYDTDDNVVKFYNGTSWIPMGTTVNRYNYTATANQTSFAATYTPGNVDVYLNGTKLTRTADYADTSGTAIVLTTGADVGDLVDIVAFSAYSVSDTVSASSGGSFLSPIGVQSQFEVRAGGGGGRYIRYIDTSGTPTKHNFELGVQRVDQAWSVTPSDTIGGTDFNSVALTVNQYGNVGIGHHNTTQTHKLVIREGGYNSGIMRIEASGSNEHFGLGLQSGEAALYAGHTGSGNTDFNIYTARGGTEWQTAKFKYNSGLELIQPDLGNWTGLNLINGRNDAADIGNLLQSTYIDFTFRDNNANAEPQVRIGAIAGEDGGDLGQPSEGSGEFFIRTYTGNNSAPYTTSTEYEGLRVTHDGIARMPNVPAFDMVRTTDINAPFTYTNITGYNTLYFDNTPSVNSGGASLANGSFTAPVDGIYHFYTWICYQNGDGSDDSHGIGFTLNGATYPAAWFRINPRYITRAGIEHVYTFQQNYELSAGDYVQVGTSDFDANGQIMEIRFGGHLVG